MAKTVKFNLILDGAPVRDINGVQENFSIEDMVGYFKTRILQRWLEVRGYSDYLEKVNAISDGNDSKVARELIKVFDLSIDDAVITEALAIYRYRKNNIESLEKYAEHQFKKKEIINDYHSGYAALKEHIKENKDNMSLLKADVIEIEKHYLGLYLLDFYRLFFTLKEEAPRAIYALLTRDSLRENLLNNKIIAQAIEKSIALSTEIKEILGDDVKAISRDTLGMWDPIVEGDKKIMLLYIPTSGSFAKSYQGDLGEKLGPEDINNIFPIIDGLEYQSNSASNELLYLEV